MKTIQVNPCIELENGVERCEVSEADFFGVYLSESDDEDLPGCFGWVADFVQKGDALRFAHELCERHGYRLENNT